MAEPNSSIKASKVAAASIASVAADDSEMLLKNKNAPDTVSVAVDVSLTFARKANELDAASVAVAVSAMVDLNV